MSNSNHLNFILFQRLFHAEDVIDKILQRRFTFEYEFSYSACIALRRQIVLYTFRAAMFCNNIVHHMFKYVCVIFKFLLLRSLKVVEDEEKLSVVLTHQYVLFFDQIVADGPRSIIIIAANLRPLGAYRLHVTLVRFQVESSACLTMHLATLVIFQLTVTSCARVNKSIA